MSKNSMDVMAMPSQASQIDLRQHTSSLASNQASSFSPTSPVYTAQRVRSFHSNNDNTAATGEFGNSHEEQSPSQYDISEKNSGFVEPIDFGSLLKSIGSSPNLSSPGASQAGNPIFASESKESLQGFFGATKSPFLELTRLNTASSNNHGSKEINVGFVDPSVQFRSLFDSAGSSQGFGPSEFLESQTSQARAYPSFTYSGKNTGPRLNEYEQAFPEDDQNRYRVSYRQIDAEFSMRNSGTHPKFSHYRDHLSNRGRIPEDTTDGYHVQAHNIRPTTSEESYNGRDASYDNSRRSNRGSTNSDESSPRYSTGSREIANSPQSKPKTSDSTNPRCKKVEKSVDYGNDHASFTDPESDYDPSTYQGRYKRQSRQRTRSSGSRRPMTCFVCEDEHGRYAEKCSYDSNGSPNNKGNYFHSESSSFTDNGRQPQRGVRFPYLTNSRSIITMNSANSVKPEFDIKHKKHKRSLHERNTENFLHYSEQPKNNLKNGNIRASFRYKSDSHRPFNDYGGPYLTRYMYPNVDDRIQGASRFHDTESTEVNQPSRVPFPRNGRTEADGQYIYHDFDIEYNDFVKNNFPELLDMSKTSVGKEALNNKQTEYVSSPEMQDTESFGIPDEYFKTRTFNDNKGPVDISDSEYHDEKTNSPEEVFQHVFDAILQDCSTFRRGGMSCYRCENSEGRLREECIHSSGDPTMKPIAYHEMTEHQSLA